MSPIHLQQFHHNEHREWMSSLNFYKEEIKIFEKELNVVLNNYSGTYSIIEHVDEYKNLFQKKLQQIDLIQDQIILHEKHISQPNEKWENEIWEHHDLRETIEQLFNEIEEQKKNFRGFVSHHFSAPD